MTCLICSTIDRKEYLGSMFSCYYVYDENFSGFKIFPAKHITDLSQEPYVAGLVMQVAATLAQYSDDYKVLYRSQMHVDDHAFAKLILL